MVGLHVLPPAVLAVLAIGDQAGHSERRFAALKGIEQVRFSQHGSALLVQNYLAGKFIVLVNEVRFDGGVVRVFRGDMLERCHTVHPELSRRAAEMRSGLQVRQGFSPDLLSVCTAGVEVPCKLVEVGAHLAALGKQGGNSG